MVDIRYEANIDGSIEPGDPFTKFNEAGEMTRIFNALGWAPNLIFKGVGGYLVYEVSANNVKKRLHVYLKKLTFGGRIKRPYEKRAQFSASIDRRGLEAPQDDSQCTVFFALYKRNADSVTIITAWDASQWGHNSGRAFNCFVDVRSVGHAAREGFSQHVTSKQQIACSFHPEYLNLYLVEKVKMHKNKFNDEELKAMNLALINVHEKPNTIPDVTALIKLTVEILKENQSQIEAKMIELKAIDQLGLNSYLITNGDSALKQLTDRLAWARFYLKRAGIIDLIGESTWRLTEIAFSDIIDPIAIKNGKI